MPKKEQCLVLSTHEVLLTNTNSDISAWVSVDTKLHVDSLLECRRVKIFLASLL